MTVLKEERRKAENVFLDEVEQDVLQKEKFLSEQIETLQEMNNNLNTLIEHKSVIQIASNIISETKEDQEKARLLELEENKQEIQMQNLEGVVRASGADKVPSTSINTISAGERLKEQQQPLIE